jgi:hypothetical protein
MLFDGWSNEVGFPLWLLAFQLDIRGMRVCCLFSFEKINELCRKVAFDQNFSLVKVFITRKDIRDKVIWFRDDVKPNDFSRMGNECVVPISIAAGKQSPWN